MQKEIYLDNSATTKPYKEVVEVMLEMLTNNYGNPSSLHMMGINAERAIKDSREIIAKTLNVDDKEIFFTSGGTEANNIAIIGAAFANKRKGKHLITTEIEHPSVLNTFKELEIQGFKVSYIKVDKEGILDIDQLEKEVCDDTILVSIMHVNNEVGTIQPIEEVRNILNSRRSKAILHIDAIQSYGKVLFSVKQLSIDIVSLSGHKIHGPKGVGALYVKKGTLIKPIVFGGNQETGMRSGTENVPGIVGFGKAAELTFQNFDKDVVNMSMFKEGLYNKIIKKIENVFINGQFPEKSAPHILNISFPGVMSEVLLNALANEGIFVSTGAACSSVKSLHSHVLTAMNVSVEHSQSAIRFSFSSFNNIEDIDYCIEHLNSIVKKLRKYTRR